MLTELELYSDPQGKPVLLDLIKATGSVFGRITFIVFFLFSLSGCASYAPAYIPSENPLAERVSSSNSTNEEADTVRDENARAIKVGQEVKITTSDGAVWVADNVRLSWRGLGLIGSKKSGNFLIPTNPLIITCLHSVGVY